MKLIYCLECQDALKIINKAIRTCHCGRCTGILADDELTATVTGPCQVIGLGSNSLLQAALKQTRIGDKGLRKMMTPAMARLKEMQKTAPLQAWAFAAMLPRSAFRGPLKGRRFTAFIIPYQASTVRRDTIVPADFTPKKLLPHNDENNQGFEQVSRTVDQRHLGNHQGRKPSPRQSSPSGTE